MGRSRVATRREWVVDGSGGAVDEVGEGGFIIHCVEWGRRESSPN